MRALKVALPEEWTRDEAISVMCRSLAQLLENWGQEGDAEAVRVAESILRRPTTLEYQRELRDLREENAQLRAALEAQGADEQTRVRIANAELGAYEERLALRDDIVEAARHMLDENCVMPATHLMVLRARVAALDAREEA